MGMREKGSLQSRHKLFLSVLQQNIWSTRHQDSYKDEKTLDSSSKHNTLTNHIMKQPAFRLLYIHMHVHAYTCTYVLLGEPKIAQLPHPTM